MNQYNYEKNGSTGRSRAKGGTRTGSTRSHTGSRTGSSTRGGTAGRSSSAAKRGGTAGRSGISGRSGARGGYGGGRSPYQHHDRDGGFQKIAIGGVLLILAIACVVFLIRGISGAGPGKESETETTTPPETELQKQVMVDGIDITGMSQEDAKAEILKKYPWAMKITWESETYEVKDLMAVKVEALLREIYSGEPEESYGLDTSGLEEAAKEEAAAVAALWDVKAKNGSISSYDAETDKFLFTGAEQGREVDQEKLAADIVSALKKKDFDAQITAVVNQVDPEFSEEVAREKYKTVSTFTTKTTANSKRNTNVRLAAEAVNGTVLQPGEEFSFNKVVGERTEAKGYKGAAAYNNGEVVEEIGGGVCQVSSTLYNAVVQAGLKTTKRQSHTFEPSYVRPGTDATISWGGPDYRFVNNSNAAIGIRARYADQTMTVSIYAIPLLEEGVTYSLKSTKLKTIDPPAPTYEEDPTLAPGVEKVKSSGSSGSLWETRLIKKKGDEVISDDVDHTVTYKGHNPVILRNSTGTMAETLPTDPSETVIDPTGQPVESGAGIGIPGDGQAGVQPGGTGGSGAVTGPGQTGAGPGGQGSSGETATGAGHGPGGSASQGGNSAGQQQTAPQTQPSTQPGQEVSPTQSSAPGASDVPVVAPNPVSG